MFIGHLGVGLALKPAAPKVNLGLLFVAVLLLDFLLGLFVLLGIEQVHIPANYAQRHYLTFTFPYSHSLIGSLVWSALAFLVTKVVLYGNRPGSTRAASVVALAVFSHFPCDVIEHVPELPLAGATSSKLGLGLWNHLGLALGLEVGLVVIGLIAYWRTAAGLTRTATLGLLALMVVLALIGVGGQALSTAAPSPTAEALTWVLQPCLIGGIAFWLDRQRTVATV